ncbi:MAG: ABC transporter six-transmembrane domain-containing protein [Myxococcales bacterium]
MPVESLGASSLGNLLRAFRGRIALTYAITLVENVLSLLYPFTTGLAVNGLLAGEGPTALWPLVAIWGFHVVLGAARQAYDTRIFASLYAELATDTVLRQRTAGIATAEIAARVGMARDAVTFFESELPNLASSAIGLVGSLGMLLVYDLPAGFWVLSLVLPVSAVYLRFGRRAKALNARLNDETEREVELIAHAPHAQLAAHFARFRGLRVALSDAEARSWSAVEACSIVAVVAVLLRTAELPQMAAGDLYAVLAYVWRVLEALDHAPLLVQRVGRLLDVRGRLELGAPGPSLP